MRQPVSSASVSAYGHDRTSNTLRAASIALHAAQVNHQVLLNTQYEARNSTKAALDAGHHLQAPNGGSPRLLPSLRGSYSTSGASLCDWRRQSSTRLPRD